MDATVRATCPKCGTGLKIPAEWVGQAVKCKKCGSVIRSKPKSGGPAQGATGTSEVPPLDAAAPRPNVPPAPAPNGNAFDFSQPKPSQETDPFPLPLPEQTPNAGFDPLGGFGADHAQQPPVQPAPAMPGYPYPVPPGYPPPGAYAPPAGYPYPVQPGYPYPVPPGYPQPGYPYSPLPPGYGPPGAYAPPPGYPYAAPPGAMPPEAANPPVMPPAPNQPAARPQPPLVNVPVKPGAVARPHPLVPAQGNPHAAQPVNAPHPVPEPIPLSDDFNTDTSAPTARRRYRQGGGKGKIFWIALCLAMTAGLVVGGIYVVKVANDKSTNDKSMDPTKLVERLGGSDPADRDAAMKTLRELGSKAGDALRVGIKSDNPEIVKRCTTLLADLNAPSGPKSGPFPRRLLFIHISKYMFLNPLTASAHGAPDRTKGAALRLAFEWHVPAEKDNNQLFLLSDTAPPEKGQDAPIPMKNVVTGAYERFFDTSRAQDRIVVYFGGHMLEKDGKAYLAPIEADLEEPESLIPLADFYAKMKSCKATQKVVIWDVCRFNPERGRQRPGADPMSESLAKSLADAPPGVEVVTTCQPGENALEFYNLQLESSANAPRFSGSLFLESAKYVAEKNKSIAKTVAQADPISIAEWAPTVGARVSLMAGASGADEKRKQTIKVDGKSPATLVAFNPEEAPAKRFDMPLAPKGTSVAEITAIAKEFFVLPIKIDLNDAGLADLPYKDEIMKDYKSDITIEEIMKDPEKYKFQMTVLDAFKTINDLWKGGGTTGGPPIHDVVKAPIDDNVKKEIFNELEFWAIGIAKLALVDGNLESVAALKEMQSKRWQAHYEYARAVVKTRLAYMNEYNKLMGDVRTETLPPIDKMLGQNQYRLVSSEKMKSKKEVQKYADEAQEAYSNLINQFKGTPWAIQAKREKAFSLGLSWRASTNGAPNTD